MKPEYNNFSYKILMRLKDFSKKYKIYRHKSKDLTISWKKQRTKSHNIKKTKRTDFNNNFKRLMRPIDLCRMKKFCWRH